MKLNELLRLHDRYSSPIGLRDNLGDVYLLKMNPIYRNIREASLRAKFKFSSARFGDYDALALTQLPKILADRKIPYLNNVSPLRDIEKKAPGVFALATIPPLKGNQIFHESAHAVAHAIILKTLPNSKKTGIARERELAQRVLLEESFANSCESIANAYSTDEAHDEFLFKNSYVMESPSFRKILNQSIATFGFEPVFRLMILSFLHSNFLKTNDIEKNLIRSIRLAFAHDEEGLQKLSDKKIKWLTQIFKGGLDLDTDFTQFTNRFCLRLLGIKTDLPKLFSFDFLGQFEASPSLSLCLDTLTQSIRPE